MDNQHPEVGGRMPEGKPGKVSDEELATVNVELQSKMGDLSRRLMVTSGSVTGLTDQLTAEGLVERTPIPADRRAYLVRLTPKGKHAFDAMAAAHERWIIDLFAGLSEAERGQLHALLGQLKTMLPAAERHQGGEERRP